MPFSPNFLLLIVGILESLIEAVLMEIELHLVMDSSLFLSIFIKFINFNKEGEVNEMWTIKFKGKSK